MASVDWRQLERDILSNLDLRAEYEKLGVKFASDRPTSKGWLSCHAMGREDKNPSAAVCVEGGGPLGVYKDHGTGQAIGFFDFALKYCGGYAEWFDAFREYGIKAGFGKKLPKKARERVEDKYRKRESIQSTSGLLLFRELCRKYGVSHKTLIELGGESAKYPAKQHDALSHLMLPVYNRSLCEAPPRGWVLHAYNGGPIPVYQGETSPPKLEKRILIGTSGLMGKWGLERLETAELIYWVEGVSDLMALHEFIPAEFKEKHVVITNAAGVSETTVIEEVAELFTGRNVVLIHDADTPGQDGAAFRVARLGRYAATVRNVQLPYAVQEKHGKDVRDWIAEFGRADGLAAGEGYNALLAMVEATKPTEKKSDASTSGDRNGEGNGHGKGSNGSNGDGGGMTRHQMVLKRIGMMILGHIEGTETIMGFSLNRGTMFEIQNHAYYRTENLLFHMGQEVENHVNLTKEVNPTLATLTQIKEAIAVEGGKRRITDSNQLGVGVWEMNGRLLLVGAGEMLIWNGDITSSKIPLIENKLVDIGSSEAWFNKEHICELFEASKSPEWCRKVFQDGKELFELWDNWVFPDTPQLAAALVCCTWLQTTWKWRPQIGVTGPTNSGKSTLMDGAVKYLFGNLALSIVKPTEASIRQHMRHTAKVLIVDEFEHDSHRQKILELFRTSSRGGVIPRGTASQRGAKYGLKHIPWVGAIEMGMKSAADRNRYILLELKDVEKGKGSKLRLPNEEYLAELGIQLMVVAMRNWRAIKEMDAIIRESEHPEFDRRMIESYSLPCAVIGVVMGMNASEARDLLFETIKTRNDHYEKVMGDEEQLLRTIYQANVLVGKELTTISECLMPGASPDESRAINSHGVAKIHARGKTAKSDAEPERVFFIADVVSQKLLGGTRFREMGIDQILMRVPGAKKSKQRMGSHQARGIAIPVDEIEKLLGGVSDDDGGGSGGSGDGGWDGEQTAGRSGTEDENLFGFDMAV